MNMTRLLFLITLAALSLSAQQANETAKPDNITDGSIYFKRETSVSMAEKLRLTQAQLQAQMALTALLQSKEYAALQRANEATQQIVTEIETNAGCKIDIAKAECLPAPKSETAKPSGNLGK